VLRRFSFADEAVIRNEEPLLRNSQGGRTLPHSKTQAQRSRGKIFARDPQSPRHPRELTTALKIHLTLSLAKGEAKKSPRNKKMHLPHLGDDLIPKDCAAIAPMRAGAQKALVARVHHLKCIRGQDQTVFGLKRRTSMAISETVQALGHKI
jgi:hypothetical protein